MDLVVSCIPMDAGDIDYLFLSSCMEKLVAEENTSRFSNEIDS